MTERPAPSIPIFEEEVPTPGQPATTAPRATPPGAFAALILGNVILAFGPWFVRLTDVGPVACGFWRIALAVPFLLAIAVKSEGVPRRIDIGLLAVLAIAGVCFAFDLSAWHAGILRTKLANATLFGNVSSFFFATYGFLIARALPGRRQSGAMLLALAGVGLLLGRSYSLSAEHMTGDLMCVFAGFCYACYMIAIDRVRGRTGTWPTLAAASLAAAIVLLPMAMLIEGHVIPHVWWPLFALAIGSQVIGQGLLIYTIRVLPPLMVGLGQLTQPVVAAVIGWMAFREHLALADCIGALAIAAALILVRKP